MKRTYRSCTDRPTDTIYRLDTLHRLHCKYQTIHPDAVPQTLSRQDHEIRRQYCISDCDPMGCLRYSRRLFHLHPNREAMAPHGRRWLHESIKVLLRSSDSQHRDGCNHPPDAHAHCVEPSHLQGTEVGSFWDIYSGILVSFVCCLYAKHFPNIRQNFNFRYHSSGRPDRAFH